MQKDIITKKDVETYHILKGNHNTLHNEEYSQIVETYHILKGNHNIVSEEPEKHIVGTYHILKGIHNEKNIWYIFAGWDVLHFEG
ncbi:hypothetical protein EMIT036CA2_40197 [Chryseobacterium sp. IT-36CA2]